MPNKHLVAKKIFFYVTMYMVYHTVSQFMNIEHCTTRVRNFFRYFVSSFDRIISFSFVLKYL